MMYIIYNHDGSIKEKNLNEFIQQGDNLTKKIGIAIVGYDATAFSLSAVFKLPNGEQTVLVSDTTTNIKDKEDNIYQGIELALTEAETALEGVVKMTIRAIQNGTDKTLTTFVTYLTINEGADPGSVAMMSIEAYENLIEAIQSQVSVSETIITFKSAMPEASNYDDNQLIYLTPQSTDVGTLYIRKTVNGSPTWMPVYDFSDHYTIDEVDTMVNAKQDKLTEESLPTAQLQYAVGFDAQGNLRKGAGGGGGAIYNAGTGIDITNFTISIDDTVVATKSFVSETYETITHASTTYATKTELETVKKNAFIKVNTTTYPTLASFLLSTGEEGYIYLYPIDTTDLTKGYYQYIWEDNAWLGIGSTRIDLSNYVTLDSAQTITGVKTVPELYIDLYRLYKNSIGAFELRGTNNAFQFNVDSYFRPSTNGTVNLGTNSQRWKNGYFKEDLYLSGKIKDGTNEFNADNVFNVINASDIASNNQLTPAQYDLITNGKPTLIKGTLSGLTNAFYSPSSLYGTDYYGMVLAGSRNPRITSYVINNSRVLSIVNLSSNQYMQLGSVKTFNDKQVPAYPTTNTSRQFLSIAANGGNLSYEYIEEVKTQSTGGATSIQLKTWVGTQAQYDSILTKDANTQYIII